MSDEKKTAATLGKTTTVQFSAEMIKEAEEAAIKKDTEEGADAGAGAGASGAGAAGAGSPNQDEKFTPTPEQTKAFFEKLGIEYKGEEDFEAIKEKLKPAAPQKTAEEVAKAEQEKELSVLSLFVENGGTVEQFNLLKEISKADPAEFSKKEIIADAIAAGFSKEEAEGIANERYYQIKLDELEPNFEEKPEDFEKRKAELKKKFEYGSKKLENHSKYKQEQAKGILKSVTEAFEAKETEKQNEVKLATNVDAFLKTLPRKNTYELGKVNDQDLAPITHEVSEESITKVAEILKDPTKRNNFFYNQDGSLNFTNLTQVMLDSFEYKRAITNSLLEGQTRATEAFRKTFPERSPGALGVGGSMVNGKGAKATVASAGKPQVIKSSQINQ